MRWPYDRNVAVLYSAAEQRATYGGLQTCGSVWHCPICAARISEARRKELAAAIAAHEARDRGEVVLLTYTIRHRKSDDLAASVDGLLKARKFARAGGPGRRFRERFGVLGSVRALEGTHGERHGWHPHLHELLFVGAGVQRGELLRVVAERWASMVGRAGLRDVNEHGVDVRFADLSAAQYVAKFGHERSWGPEHELAKAVSKSGRRKGRTPAQLLGAYTFDRDEGAGRLWQQYAAVFKGRRQLAWSPGLRERLGLDPERSDEEIAADVRAYPDILALLTSEQWRCVLGNDARAEVLQIARRGDAEGLWAFLRALGC